MIKRILLAATLLFAMPAMSCQINNAYGLSDAEKQELKVLCEQKRAAAMKLENGESDITKVVNSLDTETISKIQAISVAIVDAVTGIARGLGVEANNFIQSPAGVIVTTILIFYLVGSKIWGIFILVVIALIIKGLLDRTKRVNSTGEITEETVPVLWGLYVRKVKKVNYIPYKSWASSDQSYYTAACWAGAAIMIVAMIIIGINL